MSSIKEIAEITGLSPATVSHAINGTRAVSKRSKELVAKAVEKTGYVPNLAAQMLKTNRSNIIALILPSIETSVESNPSSNGIFFELLNGAREYLAHHGYELLVLTYSELKSDHNLTNLSLLRRKLVDGILMVPFGKTSSVIKMMQKMDIPMVLSDRRVENTDLPMVYADNYDGIKRLIRLLRNEGHQKIAFLGGTLKSSVGFDRWKGYQDALEELGIEKEDSLIRVVDKVEIEAGVTAAKELVEAGAEAICVSNHVLIMGAIKYCNENNIRIPEDVAIVGTDEYDWMQVLPTPITTMTQDHYMIGEKSAEMLLRKLNGEDIDGQRYILPCKMIISKSHFGKGET